MYRTPALIAIPQCLFLPEKSVAQPTAGLKTGWPSISTNFVPPAKNASFSAFPYVCPEPVLVK
jgi:hypothetical protein